MIALRLLAGLAILLSPLTLPAQEAADAGAALAARVLYSVRPDGTERKLLYELEDLDTISSPSISSDGRLAFAAWNQAEDDTRVNSQVFCLTLSTLRALKTLGDGARPCWSPRARRISYTRFGPNEGVWVMKSDGQNKVLLDRRGTDAQWSPNGHCIAYVKSSRGARTIAVYDMVEDRYIELWEDSGSPYGVIAGGFAWSPDSRRLCIRARRLKDNDQGLEGKSEIAIVTVDNNPRARVYDSFEGGVFPSVAWSPDGSQVVFSKSKGKNKATQLFSFDPTSKNKPVLFPGQDAERNNASPCWALDGSLLIYASGPFDTRDEEKTTTSSNGD